MFKIKFLKLIKIINTGNLIRLDRRFFVPIKSRSSKLELKDFDEKEPSSPNIEKTKFCSSGGSVALLYRFFLNKVKVFNF